MAKTTGVMTAKNDGRAAGGAPVSMIEMSKLRYASEAPPELGLQVRKSDDGEGLAELEASVRAHGVIVPLVFKETRDGNKYVTAGNRRLKMARKIYGEIDAFLPCVDSDHFKGDPREIAMATNVALPPHPVDRYEVITSLVREGMAPADAQLRFGMSQRQLAQVMKLGSLSQEIRDHYRAGLIDGKVAQAFTLSSDPKEQNRIYGMLAKRASQHHQGRVTANDVLNEVMSYKQRDVGKLVAFVGVEACRLAKILKQEDLFATNHTVTDPRALKKMVDRKLSEACDELTKLGWSWAFSMDEAPGNKWAYGLLSPAGTYKQSKEGQERLGEIAEVQQAASGEDDDRSIALRDEVERMKRSMETRAYTAEQRARSGCFLRVQADGSLEVQYGRVKPEDARKVSASERRDAAKGTSADKKKAPRDCGALTGALAERVSKDLQEAVASVLVNQPTLAAAAIVAACASNGSVLSIRVGSPGGKKPASFESVFATAANSTPSEVLLMLAQVAAHALDITTYNPDAMPMTDKGKAALLNSLPPARLNKAIRERWDAADYFTSVSLAAVVEAVRASINDEAADKVAKMKKADAAKFAAAHVPETEWLPPCLRTSHYDGPVEERRRPPAKKKPVAKKAAKR